MVALEFTMLENLFAHENGCVPVLSPCRNCQIVALLQEYLGEKYSAFAEQVRAIHEVPRRKIPLDTPFEITLQMLTLSVRTRNALENWRYYAGRTEDEIPQPRTLRGFLDLTPYQLKKVIMIGDKSIKEIKAALTEVGYELGRSY